MTITPPTTASTANTASARTGRVGRVARRLVLERFERIEDGALEVRQGDEVRTFGRHAGDLHASVRVVDERFYRAVLLRGSIGAAEAYMKGWWTTDDLTRVVRLLARNRAALQGVEGGFARLSRPLHRLYHAVRDNTRAGSRRNIAAHYDLSNEFFALFLDETMTYSCGIFEDEASTLRDASIAKIDRICDKLELRPGEHLIEIGTGWGALAVHAAREFGCRVTTTTLSKQQHAVAVQRVREAGLEDRVEVLLQDYRDLEGEFDKLVSVEMIEAVGHRHYDTFCAGIEESRGARRRPGRV